MRPGETIDGKYRIVESLGEGGMGEVFLAEHSFLEKKVAIKTLRPEIIEDPDAIRRFQREAQAAAALRHPGIIDIYDVGTLDGDRPYIVMEYLEGESLSSRIDRNGGSLEEDEAAAIAIQILGILDTVHAKKIVHRDLKPENVFLCPEEGGELVKLLDFGVSKFLAGQDSYSLTLRGELIGSIPYMAPEQAIGEDDLDHRVDIWGAGAVLYHALTGCPPFTGKAEQIIQAIVFQPVPPVSEIRPEVSPALDDIVTKALEKNPRSRYQTAADFRARLVAFRRELTESRGLPPPRYRQRSLERPSPSPLPCDEAAPSQVVHTLEVVRGQETGRSFRVEEDGLIVGRGEECDISLTDDGVSRRHAKLRLTPKGLTIVDLDSTNGLHVNGARTIRALLRDGDGIMVGHVTMLRYRCVPRRGA